MSRRLLGWLLVLVIAALLCGAVVVRYSSGPYGSQTDRPSQLAGSSAPNNIADQPVSAVQRRVEPSSNESLPEQVTDRVGAGAAGEGTRESFQQWFERYAAAQPDRRRLRQELEAALAQLPTDDGPVTTPEALAAFQALRRAEQTVGDDYATLLGQAEQFLDSYPDSPLATEVRDLFAKYSHAWDEHDFEAAREFSRANPDRFDSRIARFQAYLDRHAAAGTHGADARVAMDAIRAEWAEHDYQSIYEFSQRYPSDIAAVAGRVRHFVDDHPASQRRRAADQFLARYEKAATTGEYRVRVKSGVFDRSIARALSLGPDLAVEIEVAGIRIGRTPIVPDSFEPVWEYEFPQNVRWRMGDPVKIRVIDFDYANRTILKIESADEPLAMRYLSGTLRAQGHQVTFESNFQAPSLPAPSERSVGGR